jgi:hypothetical protein
MGSECGQAASVDYAAYCRDVVYEAVSRVDKLNFGRLVEGPCESGASVSAAYNDYSLHHDFSSTPTIALSDRTVSVYERLSDRKVKGASPTCEGVTK